MLEVSFHLDVAPFGPLDDRGDRLLTDVFEAVLRSLVAVDVLVAAVGVVDVAVDDVQDV